MDVDSTPMTARESHPGRLARRVRRAAVGSGAIAIISIAATHPVAAQFATESTVAQSANSDLIGDLYRRLVAIALPITVLSLAALWYAVVRFRDADEPTPTLEKPTLELSWTVATIVVLLVVGLWTYPILATPYLSPGLDASGDGETNATEIEVVGSQWQWRFAYEDGAVTTRDELVVPADEEVRFVLTSRDVIHAFAVPDLGLKRNAVPGEETTIRTRVHEPGTYRARCTAFCGARHDEMTATVIVVDRETYDAWLAAREGEDGPVEPPDPSAAGAGSVDHR